jgi:hypothetical protein
MQNMKRPIESTTLCCSSISLGRSNISGLIAELEDLLLNGFEVSRGMASTRTRSMRGSAAMRFIKTSWSLRQCDSSQ